MKFSVLHQVRARLTGWLILRGVLAGLGVVLAGLLTALLADAALDLPEPLRAATGWLPGLAVVVVIGAGGFAWWQLTEARLARQFEQANPALGNRLINAVQLAQAPAAEGAAEMFRRQVVELGRQTAATLVAWPVVRRGIRRAAALLSLVMLGWAILVSVNLELVQTVAPRFLDPHGDHPPYSRLHIQVSADGSEVLYGGQVAVRATTRGRPVDKLWLVARSGTNESRTIMFLAADRSFFQSLVNLRAPVEYYVTDGTARSRRYPVGIRYTPRITMVEVTTTFPEYTGKPPHTGKLPAEAQAFPEGTRVSFRVASNRPLQSGLLNLTPVLGGTNLSVFLRPEAQNTVVTGAFVLSQAVLFELSVRDVAGLDSPDKQRGRFNLLPDRPPKIFVLEPGRDAVATPDIRVPVRVRAEDDYAVARVVWLRSLNRSLEHPRDLPLTLKNGAASVEATGAFDLGSLGVRPGDVIEYYFEALDNYPAGPNVTFSRPFRLEIISHEQFDTIVRQNAARKALFEPYFKLDAWMRRMAERARDLAAKAKSGDPAAAAGAAQLARELEEYTKALNKLLAESAMFDVDNSFHTTLAEQAEQLEAARDRLSSALGGGTLDPAQMQKVSAMLTRLAQTSEEQVEQPAQQIAAVVRVVTKADTFVKLAQQQAAVAQLLRRFADKTDALTRAEQMEVQELSHQQHRIRDEVHELLSQMPELVAQVPEDPQYAPLRDDVKSFLAAVAEESIEQDLTGAANALEEPDALTGHALAQRAAEAMDKLIARCKGMPDQGEQCLTAHFQPKLTQPGLGNTLQQILASLNVGNGQGGRDGYGMFNEDVAIYGPNVELAGEQAGGHGDTSAATGTASATIAGGVPDAQALPNASSGPVHLQPDAKFPLRYRDLVGEYFRVMAETGKDEK